MENITTTHDAVEAARASRDFRIEKALCKAEDILLQALANLQVGQFRGWVFLDHPLSANTFTSLAMRTTCRGSIKLFAVDHTTMAVRDVAM